MKAQSLLQHARPSAQFPFRQAHVERQARERGTCICGVPTVLHYAGVGCQGAFLGCEVARILESCAAQVAAVFRQHAAESGSSRRGAATPERGEAR